MDYQFKVLLLGDSGVGKTSLMNRFTDGKFSTETKSTIGVEYSKKTVNVEGSLIQASIWDTAGQERFRAMAKTYYKGAVGALVVYDVTKPHTLESVHKLWMTEIKQHAMQNIKIVLIGNKIDLAEERLVKKEEAKAIAEEYQLPYIETSAQSDSNVEAAFELLCRGIFLLFRRHNLASITFPIFFFLFFSFRTYFLPCL